MISKAGTPEARVNCSRVISSRPCAAISRKAESITCRCCSDVRTPELIRKTSLSDFFCPGPHCGAEGKVLCRQIRTGIPARQDDPCDPLGGYDDGRNASARLGPVPYQKEIFNRSRVGQPRRAKLSRRHLPAQ